MNWTEPALVEVLGHYLDAMGPFLKYFPDAVGSVINKLFELLNSLPFIVKVLLFLSLFRPITCNKDEELCLIYPNFLFGRILQQAVRDMQGCRFVHHLFEWPKLLTKVFSLT